MALRPRSTPRRRGRVIAALCALVAAPACQSGGGPSDAARDDDAARGGDGAAGDGAAAPDAAGDTTNDVGDDDAAAGDGGDDAGICTTPAAMRPPGAVCVVAVTGRAVDLAGAPLARVPVSVCGAACFYARTGDDGAFAVNVGDFLPVVDYSVQVHGRPDYATLYVPLPTTVPEMAPLALPAPLVVPRYTDVGGEFPDMVATDLALTAGDVTVRAPAGTRIVIDIEDVDLGALGRELRTARVPVAQAPEALRAAGIGALWALAPFNMTASTAMPVAVRNPDRAMFTAGSAVDFVALGGVYYPPPGDAGDAVMVGAGHVSADGATIATDPGVGLTRLTWLGVRAH